MLYGYKKPKFEINILGPKVYKVPLLNQLSLSQS